MNITFLCKRYHPVGSECSSAAIVPGEEINTSAELRRGLRSNGRVVKDVPSDRVLLLDICCGGRLKTLPDDCQFFIPTNDFEWGEVSPVFKELAERRVLVLSEISKKYPNLLDIKEECRKSFYLPTTGQLINKKFERDNLSPEKMAEAGLKFVGDQSRDRTMCRFERGHQIRGWTPADEPKARHLNEFRCLCIEDLMYKIPVLSVADGQTIPVQAYKVIMYVGSGIKCNDAVLIGHSGAPIEMAPWSDIVSTVNAAKLAVIESSILNSRATVKAANVECFELVKQSIFLTSFSSLMRDYHCVSNDFISQLQEYKTELNSPTELAAADVLLEKLSFCSALRIEVWEAINRMAALNLVKEHASQLTLLPSAAHEAISSGMELAATKEVQELAGSYEQRYFINDCLNELVKDGSLGCLFTSDYFCASKRCEKLMSLLTKGTELLHILVCISEAIRELLEPYSSSRHEASH